MKSYVATRLGPFGRINELSNIYLRHTRNVPQKVHGILEEVRYSSERISSLLGAPTSGLSMLEIGPGQQLAQLAYFAAQNDVVGIDSDVIPQRMNLRSCIAMVRQNGWLRTSKTVVRRMAGIDGAMRAELMLQLGLRAMPEMRVLQMDAGRMTFPVDHFDAVYSRAVFEHLPDPVAVISEIRRVLKPGGVMFVRLHLFTSDSGCHDTRIFLGQRRALPFWAHLRPEHARSVRSNTYLNKLRLADWIRIFESEMPGSEVSALCDAGETERRELRTLRARGHLAAYSDSELLSVTVEASWRKPV